MKTNKPEVMAYWSPTCEEVVSQQDYAGWEHNAFRNPDTEYGNRYRDKTLEYSEPLICLSDYEALQAEYEKLRKDAERYRYIKKKKGNQWIVAATQTGFHIDEEDLDTLIDEEMEQWP